MEGGNGVVDYLESARVVEVRVFQGVPKKIKAMADKDRR